MGAGPVNDVQVWKQLVKIVTNGQLLNRPLGIEVKTVCLKQSKKVVTSGQLSNKPLGMVAKAEQ